MLANLYITQKPLFFFGLTEIEIKEGETKEIPILKFGSERGSVWVCSSSGTGINGANEDDYTPIKKLIVFSEYEDCKLIRITALADYKDEPDEIFRLQLLATEMGTVGNPSVMVVTIKDMPRPDTPGQPSSRLSGFAWGLFLFLKFVPANAVINIVSIVETNWWGFGLSSQLSNW